MFGLVPSRAHAASLFISRTVAGSPLQRQSRRMDEGRPSSIDLALDTEPHPTGMKEAIDSARHHNWAANELEVAIPRGRSRSCDVLRDRICIHAAKVIIDRRGASCDALL